MFVDWLLEEKIQKNLDWGRSVGKLWGQVFLRRPGCRDTDGTGRCLPMPSATGDGFVRRWGDVRCPVLAACHLVPPGGLG